MNTIHEPQATRNGRRRLWLAGLLSLTVVLTVPAVAGAANRTGTEGPDRIVATRGDDVINGLGGNDTIFAGKGRDRVDGGSGNDRIEGEDSPDVLSGNSGDDLIDGGDNDDRLSGGPGNDYLQGSSGDDALDGGPGNDRLLGGANTDVYTFRGRFGNDLVIDRSGNRDILVFPDVSLSQAKVVKKGLDNVVVITPGGQVEIVDGNLGACDESKNRSSEVEGLVFKGGQQAEIRTGRSLQLVPVTKINTTDCGGQFCIGTSSSVCPDGFFFDPD